IQVSDVRQICGEDDLAPLSPDHTICDCQEPMQVLIAVGTRSQNVVRVLDDESIMRSCDEADEDLVVLKRLLVTRVHDLGARALSARHFPQYRTHESGLARARRAQEDQDGL